MMFPMKNQPILTPPPPPLLYNIPLFLYMAALLVLVTGESYNATDYISLACGSSYNLDFDDRIWIGDTDPQYAPTNVGNSSQVGSPSPPVHPVRTSPRRPEVPYGTARLSHSNFTYSFHVTAGQKFIRLYFNPLSYGPTFDRSNSLFSVTAGGFTLLKDFNASVYADVTTPQFVREFCVNVEAEAEQRLNITFIPSKLANNVNAYAFINGIEIISMPTNLYYGGEAKIVGNDNSYRVDNSTAMGMIFRINVGGKLVSPGEDTGMYRTWDNTDDEYLDQESMTNSLTPSNTSNQLKFTKTPEYVAPKPVYQTGRSMGNNITINLSYNLTWNFPVDSGFNYLVRLHFCEFKHFFFNPFDRVFLIYINNILVEENADIIMWSGDNGIPVYRDYYTPILRQESQDVADISIALHPYNFHGYTRYIDALLNGLEIFKLNDSNGNLGGPNPTPPGKNQENPTVPSSLRPKKSKTMLAKTMLAIICGAVFSGTILFSSLGYLVIQKPWKAKDDTRSSHRMIKSTATPESLLPSYLCRYFSLKEIKAATKNFNATLIIGVGGFGNVYKGCIDGGTTPVAIKRRNPESSQGSHEFKTEIEMLSQLRYRHLVSLIGYCADKSEMILVYDYMDNGTLRDHLYHTDNPPLPWEQRLQICIGTARGLQYLHNGVKGTAQGLQYHHSGVKGTIIHRDVKSTNILLDEKWVAKVSDFGMSKGTNNMSKTHISTVVKGTFGYLDPEYYRRQCLTDKSDVYSLGVVLFEVLCARPAVIRTAEMKQANLAEWAKTCYQNGEIDQIIDSRLRGEIAAECLNKFTEVAISCMHDNGTERPSMTDVVKGLELALDLHHSAKGIINCTGRNGETEISRENQSHFPNDSIKCISATIFSEINNPSGR